MQGMKVGGASALPRHCRNLSEEYEGNCTMKKNTEKHSA